MSYLACVDIEVVVPVLAEEVGEDLRRPDLAVAADELDDLLPVVCHEGNRAQHVANVAASHKMTDKGLRMAAVWTDIVRNNR